MVPIEKFDFSTLAERQVIVPSIDASGSYTIEDVTVGDYIAAGTYAIVFKCDRGGQGYAMRVFQNESFLDGHREAIFAEYCASRLIPETNPDDQNTNLGPVIVSRYRIPPSHLRPSFTDHVKQITLTQINPSMIDLNQPLDVDVMERFDVTLFDYMCGEKSKGMVPHLIFVNLMKYVVSPTVISSFLERMNIMHANRIVHCDLHAANIMCNLDKNKNIVALKAIDYGFGMFNDRVSEPRFHPSDLRLRYQHARTLANRYLPMTSKYQIFLPEQLSDVTNFDAWVVEGFQFSETFEHTGNANLISKIGTLAKKLQGKYKIIDYGGQDHTSRRRVYPLPSDFNINVIPLPANVPTNRLPQPKSVTDQLNLWPFYGHRITNLDASKKPLTGENKIRTVLGEYLRAFEPNHFRKILDGIIVRLTQQIENAPTIEKFELKNQRDSLKYVFPEILTVVQAIYQNSKFNPSGHYPKLNFMMYPQSEQFTYSAFMEYLDRLVVQKIKEINSL